MAESSVVISRFIIDIDILCKIYIVKVAQGLSVLLIFKIKLPEFCLLNFLYCFSILFYSCLYLYYIFPSVCLLLKIGT